MQRLHEDDLAGHPAASGRLGASGPAGDCGGGPGHRTRAPQHASSPRRRRPCIPSARTSSSRGGGNSSGEEIAIRWPISQIEVTGHNSCGLGSRDRWETWVDDSAYLRPLRVHKGRPAALSQFSKADTTTARATDHNGQVAVISHAPQNARPEVLNLLEHKQHGRDGRACPPRCLRPPPKACRAAGFPSSRGPGTPPRHGRARSRKPFPRRAFASKRPA